MQVNYVSFNDPITLENKAYYRVFHVIGHQEHGCCEHVFGLIGIQKASMGHQVCAQITFRSEIHPDLFQSEYAR